MDEQVSEEDLRIMGTPEQAREALIAKLREWRELRQPLIATSKEHRERERRENQLRFEICNVGLLWLWHDENQATARAERRAGG